MAKRPSLAASMKAIAREPIDESATIDASATAPAPALAPAIEAAPAPATPAPAPAAHTIKAADEAGAGSGYRAKTREGMKRLTVVVPPEDHRRIKRLSVDLDRSIEDLMREALADLLQRHTA